MHYFAVYGGIKGMNVRWIVSVCIACLICSGCSMCGPGLSTCPDRNLRAMRRYVPAGTSMEDAIAKMKKSGFACQLIREKLSGTIVDCIRCEKLEQGRVQNYWNVYLVMDSTQRVQEWMVISRVINQ
jgi:hypothetical protein